MGLVLNRARELHLKWETAGAISRKQTQKQGLCFTLMAISTTRQLETFQRDCIRTLLVSCSPIILCECSDHTSWRDFWGYSLTAQLFQIYVSWSPCSGVCHVPPLFAPLLLCPLQAAGSWEGGGVSYSLLLLNVWINGPAHYSNITQGFCLCFLKFLPKSWCT